VTETTTRRLMQRDERQAQILRAAAVAFARTGFAGTSMDDVATEAGITRLIVYRHFDSKEDLYRAVLTQVTDTLSDEWQRGLARPDRRGFVFETLLSAARRHPDGFRLLFEHAAREPKFAAFAEEVHQLQVDLADELVGEAIPDPLRRAWATRTIVGYLVDSVLAWLEVGDPSRDRDFVEQATDGLLALYRAWTGEPAPSSLPPTAADPATSTGRG
jgi:AcrR family transcriptional regulator